jgi:hypothetical protein
MIRSTTPLRAAVAAWLLAAAAALAAPFVPATDDSIVERLPARTDPAERARRAALARDVHQLPLALDLAQAAILRARRQGDPRELGAAQAALAPWWPDAQAPAPVRLLRATILQSRHDFTAALTDLDRLVAETATPQPLRAQALLTRASLHQVLGRFDAARRDCDALLQPVFTPLGEGLRRTAQACTLELQSLTDDARIARRALDTLAGRGGVGQTADPWLALLRAELAERLGDDAAAQTHFAAAGADGDVYTLAAHADWLLDRRRDAEALAVLARGPAQADALLLRRAIAWQRLGDARAAAAAADLRTRFAAVRLRGDAPHLREEARLALEIDRDPKQALALARQQWALQKEPADAVLLLRAGRAAGQDISRELAAWLPDPARADVRLAAATDARGLTRRNAP